MDYPDRQLVVTEPCDTLFLLLDRQKRRLQHIHPLGRVPSDLLPKPDAAWPDQLPPAQAARLHALLSQGQQATLTLTLADSLWHLELAPAEAPYWLLTARRQKTTLPDYQSLAILEMALCASHYQQGLRRNRHILECLYQAAGCERLILWSLNDTSMSPIFMLGQEPLPPAQSVDRRYLKALRSRGSLGFSDLQQQPMLASQTYLHQTDILARLDGAVRKQDHLYAILTLEYHSIQSSFDPLTFRLVEQACALLAPEQTSPEETTWLPEFNSRIALLDGTPLLAACAGLVADLAHAAQVLVGSWMPGHENHYALRYDRGWVDMQPDQEPPLFLQDPCCWPVPAMLDSDQLATLQTERLPGQPLLHSGYLYPLLGPRQQPTGFICLLFAHEPADIPRLEQMLNLMAWRIAQELQHRALELALAVERAVFQQTPQPLLVVDMSGRITQSNTAICRLMGWDNQAMKGGSIDRLRPRPRGAGLPAALKRAMRNRDQWQGHLRLQHCHGHDLWLALQVRRLQLAMARDYYLYSFCLPESLPGR